MQRVPADVFIRVPLLTASQRQKVEEQSAVHETPGVVQVQAYAVTKKVERRIIVWATYYGRASFTFCRGEYHTEVLELFRDLTHRHGRHRGRVRGLVPVPHSLSNHQTVSVCRELRRKRGQIQIPRKGAWYPFLKG